MVVQGAMARLKERWLVLKRELWRPDKHRLPRIIYACYLLTNIMIDCEDSQKSKNMSESRQLLTRAVDEQEFEEVVDPRLAGNFDDVEMFRHSAARRPKMGQVVRILDSPTLNNVDLTNDVQTGMNQMFNVTAYIRQI
ncbi:hypothetical protein ACQ4PT_033670 [Festuca glaucescens]